MTGYLRRSARGNEASIKYYIFGTVSGAAMVYGLSWWFGLAGTTSLPAIGRALADAPDGIVIASTALVLFGLGYKAALVPFHFWTPDAYDGAPLSVAAYLSVLPKLAASSRSPGCCRSRCPTTPPGGRPPWPCSPPSP